MRSPAGLLACVYAGVESDSGGREGAVKEG